MAQQAVGQDRAAGWMKDPSGRHFGRYWDGEQWTEHVISAETAPSIDPVNQRSPGHAQEDRGEAASSGEQRGSWEKDPSGRHSTRYWDGRRWTQHVMSAARVPSIDPVVQESFEPHRTAPAPTQVAPVVVATKLTSDPAGSESLGSRRPRPPWTRSAPWAVAVIASGLAIIGVALNGSDPRPTKGGTAVTAPIATTVPSAVAPVATTIPLASEAPIILPGASADTGVAVTTPVTTPVTAPGTSSGSQAPVTVPPSVDPPITVPQPAESIADPSMSTTS